MRRIFALVLVLALPFCLIAQDKARPAGKPNTLTPDEIQAGWLLLFDGETSFGWRVVGDVKVEKGVLVIGGERETTAAPTTWFSGFAVQFEADYQGEKPPSFDMGFPGLIKGSLAKSNKGKFVPQSSRVFFSGALPRRPLHFTVPAGSKLLLRNVKLQPVGGASFDFDSEEEDGKKKKKQPSQRMTALFNGKDLDGWKVFEGKGKKSKFTVTKEGWLNVKDGPGDLQTKSTYADFVLQLECISNGEHLNSGIFFRAIPDEYQQGYECQIRNQFTTKLTKYQVEEHDPKTHALLGKKAIESPAVDFGTGAIYRRMPARKGIAKDGEWFTLTLVARGRHLATWVNGIQVVDWTDHRPAKDNARQGYREAEGVISIQGHDPTTDLSFRNLRISRMPREKTKK